jgi:hypothetical protein
MYSNGLPREGASTKGDNVMDNKLFNNMSFLDNEEDTSIEEQEANVEIDNAAFNNSEDDQSNR